MLIGKSKIASETRDYAVKPRTFKLGFPWTDERKRSVSVKHKLFFLVIY
jgi:hypothetical protein